MKLHHVLIPALLVTTSAYAADLTSYSAPPQPAAPTQYDWSGFYIGLHGGYGAGSTHVVTTLHDAAGAPLAATANNSFDMDGILGGIQAGYNWQFNRVVFGIEGEYSVADIDGDFNYDPARPEAVAGGKLKAIADVKARIGYAFNRTFVYGTAGYALGWNDAFANNVFAAAPATDHATGDKTSDGVVLGVGVEHALTKHITVKGEYDYYHFSSTSFDLHSTAYPAGVALRTEPSSDIHTFKVGLNYKF